MDSELRIIDRGQIFEAARHALGLHRWLVDPDFDQEGALLPAGLAVHRWIDDGGARAPIRAALNRLCAREPRNPFAN